MKKKTAVDDYYSNGRYIDVALFLMNSYILFHNNESGYHQTMNIYVYIYIYTFVVEKNDAIKIKYESI
jgi:hypothetical protein